MELFKIGYWHDTLPALAARTRGKLPVRCDPRDLSRVWLRLPDEGEYLELHYKDPRRREVDAVARFEAVEAQRRLPAEAAKKTKATRRLSQRTAHARAGTARVRSRASNPEEAAGPGIDYSQPPEILDVEVWS